MQYRAIKWIKSCKMLAGKLLDEYILFIQYTYTDKIAVCHLKEKNAKVIFTRVQ